MFPWIFLGKGFWDLLEINWYEWLALYAVSCRQLAATFLSSFSVIFSIFSLSRPFLVEWLHKLKLLYSYIKWFINQWVHPFKTTSSSLSPLMTIWNFAVGVVWKWGASASFAGRLVFAEMNWHKEIPQSGICPAPCALRQCTVVFAWKCCLFCLCTHVQCRVCYIYHVEFHFRFRRLLSFPVKHQLWSGCHGEKSSKKNIR